MTNAEENPVSEEMPAEVVESAPEPIEDPGDAGELEGGDLVEAPAADSEPADPFAEYGGLENIKAAHRLYEASRTNDGVTQLFIEAGQALGMGARDLEAFVTQAMSGSVPEAGDEDLDRALTVREVQEMLAQRDQSFADRERKAAENNARRVVADTLGTLGLEAGSDEAELALKLGDKYLKGDLSAEAVANAVRRGHADLQVILAKQHKDTVSKKVEQRKLLPSSPAGSGAPATPPADEPKDVAEASKRFRKAMGW